MPKLLASKEFIGRIPFSYKDGKSIYAYDRITHGLYRLSFDLRRADMILSPESIYRNPLSSKIIGISKSRDEIILIPYDLDAEWVFYDIKKEKIRYDFPIKNKACISSAVTIGTNLFLIPANICNPIIIFSLDEMKVIKIYEQWYEQNKEGFRHRTLFWIWGAASHRDFVAFPMINSHYIGCIKGENAWVLTFDIPHPIISVSVYMDRIWILPTAGEYIYISDFKGNIVGKVKLIQKEMNISAKSFRRIISIGQNIFLLPVYGGNICVYQCGEKRVVELERKKKPLRGRLFEEDILPYWDYVIEDEMIHVLPCDYRYKKIDMSSLKNEEQSFEYGENIDHDKYWEMIGHIQRESILEKGEYDLDDFFQYIHYLYKGYHIKKNKENGERIWMMTRKERQ